jgi:hypothetical protein
MRANGDARVRAWRFLSVLILAMNLGCSGSSNTNGSGGDLSGGSGGTTGGSGGTTGGSAGLGGSGALGGTAGATDCGTLTAAQARDIVIANVEHVLRTTLDVAGFLEADPVISQLLTGEQADPVEFVADVDENITELVANLRDEFLVDANVESAVGNTVHYVLNPDVYCPEDPDLVATDPEYAAELELACRDSLAAHPIRFDLTRVACDAGNNLRLDLMVSSEPLRPLSVNLFTTSLAAEVDLGATLTALQRTGSFADSFVLDSDVGGHGVATLDVGQTGRAALTVGISEALVYGGSQDGEHGRIQVAPSPEALDVTLVSPGETVTGSVAMGRIDVTWPFSDFMSSFFGRTVLDTVPASEVVEISVPAVTAEFSAVLGITRTGNWIEVTGLGLGPESAVARRGADTLLAVDVNAAGERTVDVTALLDFQDEMSLSIEPSFDLAIEYNLAPVAELVSNLQPFALDDTFRIRHNGQAPAVTRLMRDAGGRFTLYDLASAPLLDVETGTLTLESRSFPEANVSVPTGSCLSRDTSLAGEHDILRGFFAGECPP